MKKLKPIGIVLALATGISVVIFCVTVTILVVASWISSQDVINQDLILIGYIFLCALICSIIVYYKAIKK